MKQMNTKTLRQQVREKRRNLSDTEREQAAFLLCERIASSREFNEANTLHFISRTMVKWILVYSLNTPGKKENTVT